MNSTYKAVEITRPGVFTLTQRRLTEPAAGQVRIRVEACGICHSDSGTVDNVLPGITFPRVPGHEVVGKIDAVGKASLVGKSVSASVLAFLATLRDNANRAVAVILSPAQISR